MSVDKKTVASSTDSVHAGVPAGRPHNALALSIEATATFTFANTAELERYMRGEDPDPSREEYGRYGNPTVCELERRVADWSWPRPASRSRAAWPRSRRRCFRWSKP